MSQRQPERAESPTRPDPNERGTPSDGECARLVALLDERLRFETLLSRLSATFIHLPAGDVDGQIEYGLGQIVDFLGLDRSSVAQFSDDGHEFVVTHSFTVAGIPPLPLVNLAPLWPWYTARLLAGDVLRLSRLPDDLPAEAVAEREHCLRGGLPVSHLAIPFKVGSSVLGAIGFGSFHQHRDWPEPLVQGLQLVGEVFANALARKRAQEHESRLREQLTLAARVSLVGELAASIAHEVNQPLCAIVSNAQTARRLLAAEEPDRAEVRAALDDIAQDGQRASAVIARIRGLLQKSPSQRGLLDVNDLIREVTALTRGEMVRRGVAVAVNLADPLPPVMADRVQLQQVLLNLLANAADAIDRAVGGPRQVVVRSVACDVGTVSVVVQDSGAGIAPQELDRVFDPFFTTRSGGMGMGLAICKSIVTAHGGRIGVFDNGGSGAAFQFTLPAVREG